MSFSPSQLDLIAKCAVSGMRTVEIAEYARVGEQAVRNLVNGGHDEQFDRIYNEYRRQALTSLVDHRFKMLEFLPQAYDNARYFLGSENNDKKLRWEATRWYFASVMGTGENSSQQNLNVNVGIQQNTVAGEQVTVALTDISSTVTSLLSSLRETRVIAGPDPHEKIGDAALPASYQLVKDAAAEGPSLGAKPNGLPREAGQQVSAEGTPITNGSGDPE